VLFDVTMENFARKARLVDVGHMTKVLAAATYVSF
jgi:hypothetical protein